MSVVTGVTIVSQCCDDGEIGALVENLNDWIASDNPCGGGRLNQVDEHYGGGKHPENLVYGGGFNYLSWQKFIYYAQNLPWKEAVTLPEESSVIMIVSPDQHPAEIVMLHKATGY